MNRNARTAHVGDEVELGDALYDVEVAHEHSGDCHVCERELEPGEDVFVADEDDFQMCRACAERE